MKLNKKMNNVITDLEYIIGWSCYNPNSYDGWTCEEGRSFRYPVNVQIHEDEYYIKIRSKVSETDYIERLTAKMIKSMKYKFGSNEMYIGGGLIRVLEYLENRYGIDFNQLENELNKKPKPEE